MLIFVPKLVTRWSSFSTFPILKIDILNFVLRIIAAHASARLESHENPVNLNTISLSVALRFEKTGEQMGEKKQVLFTGYDYSTSP